ncbi:DUF4342 domain-containing protein [Fusibacter ferrireducens]|uniref:DUF4342 domain-containing protein n=1 Tax=Fusibacter ferrireducens TaxID=2785058 RepID=A0ABR9ZWT4_9FIRM|nr:DUF4342 domain-containing protein [Fusibacter ferrireducens]MBF4694927.1 DUF4342 domain-containing protein [Fusibacter ferrireducens]
MRITLEMVDEVINRTGATYKEAKNALEDNEGDLLKAIVYLEELKNEPNKSEHKNMSGQEIVDKLKSWVNEGFINQITIVKAGKTVVDIPIMAGAIGAVIFTIPTVAAIITAVATGCEIKIVKSDGEIININEMTQEKFDDLKSVFQDKKKSSSEKTEDSQMNEDSQTTEETETDETDLFEEDIFEEEKN